MSGGFLSHGGTIIKFKPSILIGFPIINKYYKPSINGGGIPYGKLQRSSLWYQKDQKRHGFFRDMYEEGEATKTMGFRFFHEIGLVYFGDNNETMVFYIMNFHVGII